MAQGFEVWYGADRSYAAVVQQFSVSETTVHVWARNWKWKERADARDAEVARKAELDAVRRKAALLTEQRKAGELLRRRGVEFFVKHEVEDGRTAIAAVSKGVELERQAEQMPDYLLAVMGMNEDELRSDLERLRRATAGMVDAATPALPAAGSAEGEGEPGENGSDPVLPAAADAEAADISGPDLS